ncbi:MAG: flagellar hook-associated protein FlgK [Rhodothalassiaceae bacterium]|nr:MAG: flagellar hook-associated protein FlgK [Rhodothalassiaceae bacterium]
MALNGILFTSLTGLQVSQEALRVTSDNIANVNTPNYARQAVRQEAVLAGGKSNGVDIQAVERVIDRFLERASLAATSEAERNDTMALLHDRLQAALGRPDAETNLSARMNKLFESLAALALDPADAVTRQQFLGDLGAYTAEVSRIASALQELRGDASAEIEARLPAINATIKEIFELNRDVVQQTVLSGEPGPAENQRDAALARLAEQIDIRIIENGDGSVDVVTTSGVALVTKASFAELAYKSPGNVTAGTQFPPITISRINPFTNQPTGTVRALDGDIRSGALRGLLDMRDKDLVNLSLALGELAARVADEVNAVHNANTAVPPPNTLTGDVVGLDASAPHHFTGVAHFAVVDQNGTLIASASYDFDANPTASLASVIATVNAGLGGAGTLSFTNGVMQFQAANPANGVVIAQDEARPSDRAGRGFAHFFGMNDLLTARAPGLYETGVAAGDAHNLQPGGQIELAVKDAFGRTIADVAIPLGGTSTFGDIVTALNDPTAGLGNLFQFSLDSAGRLVITPTSNAPSGARLAVVNDTTDLAGTGVSISRFFGIGDPFRAEAAADMRIVEEVPADAGLLATARLKLTALPGEVALFKGDQAGALALQALETKVINFSDAGELAAQARTLSSFNGAVIGNFAQLADRAKLARDDTRNQKTEIDQRRNSISGVNLDEELANLVIFQNSYNAAARALSTVQQLYDALLSVI